MAWAKSLLTGSSLGAGADRTTWLVAADGRSISKLIASDQWKAISFDQTGIRTIRSVAADAFGYPWVTTADLEIHKYQAGRWQKKPGFARFIAAGADRSLWTVGKEGKRVYKQVTDDNWTRIPFDETGTRAARWVSADASGNPWIVTEQAEIFVFESGRWTQSSGLATAVRTGADGLLRTIGSKGKRIFTLLPNDQAVKTSFDESGRMTAIDVAADHLGNLWVLTSAQELFRIADVDRPSKFKPAQAGRRLDHPPGFSRETTLLFFKATTADNLDPALPPAVTRLLDGSIAVAYERATGAAVQVYKIDGTPVGGEVRLPDRGINRPRIAPLDDGGFVVVWKSLTPAHLEAGMRFSEDQTVVPVLSPDGAWRDVFDLNSDWANVPGITAIPNGRFMISFLDGDMIKVRRFPSAGDLRPPGDLFVMDTPYDETQFTDIVALPDGSFLSAYTRLYPSGPHESRALHFGYFLFMASGEKTAFFESSDDGPDPVWSGSALPADSTQPYRLLAMSPDNFLVIWPIERSGSHLIVGKRTDATGLQIGNRMEISRVAKRVDNWPPSLRVAALQSSILPFEDFIVGWDAQDGPPPSSALGRIFDHDGDPCGPEFTCNHQAPCRHVSLVQVDDDTCLDVAMTRDGVLWNLQADVFVRTKLREFAIIFFFGTYDGDDVWSGDAAARNYNASVLAGAHYNTVLAGANDVDTFRDRLAAFKQHGLRFLFNARTVTLIDLVRENQDELVDEVGVWGYMLENDLKSGTVGQNKVFAVHAADPTHPTFAGYNNTLGPTGDSHTDVICMYEYAMEPAQNAFGHEYSVLQSYSSVAYKEQKTLYRGMRAITKVSRTVKAALGGGLADRRFIVYSSLAYGVKGIVWFAGTDLVKVDDATHRLGEWNDFGKVIQSLNEEIRAVGAEMMSLQPDMLVREDGSLCNVYSTGRSIGLNEHGPLTQTRTAVKGTIPLFKSLEKKEGWQVAGKLQDVLVDVTSGEVCIGSFVDSGGRLVLLVVNHHNYLAQTGVQLQLANVHAIERFHVPRGEHDLMTAGSQCVWQRVPFAGTWTTDLPSGGGELIRITISKLGHFPARQ